MNYKYTFLTLLFYFFFVSFSSLEAQPGTWEYIHNGNNCTAHGTAGSCMQGRHEASYVQVGDKFYLLGGRENNSNVNIYDPIRGIWTVGADAPFAIHHFQAVEYNGLILIMGALTGRFPGETPVPNIMIYDPETDRWSTGPSIPANRRRGSAGVVVYNKKIYMVSGIVDGHRSGWVPWLDEYDPEAGTWRTLSNAPHSRDHFHAALFEDKIVVGGGRRSGQNGIFLATEGAVDIYDISAQSWTTNARDLPTHRAAPVVGVIGDEVLFMGGERNDGRANNETEALNMRTGLWRTLKPMLTGRHGTQAIVNNENIWVASGSPNRGGGNVQSQERFFLSSRRSPSVRNISRSAISAQASASIANGATERIFINNSSGDQAVLVTGIDLLDGGYNINFSRSLPFFLPPGTRFAVDVTHTNGNNARLRVRHTGSNSQNIVNISNESVPGNGTVTNLALRKPTLQSSTSHNGAASRAVDGNTNGAYGGNSVTHTNNSTNPWWRVDLGATFNIENITINNRTDCCTDRLSGAIVYVGNANSTNPNDFTEVGRLNTNATQSLNGGNRSARYVMVHIPGNNKTLSLAEVQVFGTASTSDGNTGNTPTTSTPTTGGGTSSEGGIVHIRKRNATGFALDGQANAANGQNIHLWPQSTNNENQLWREIDRGNGFYSYQKVNTNHCIDGGVGGADNQNVHLWICNENNQNQHWRKDNVGGGAVRLVKRNANAFALNGGDGGSNGQNVNLSSNATSQNLHWLIEPIISGGSTDCSENVALGKSATQSSTLSHPINFSASNAVDGNNSGNHVDGSMTHTNTQNNAWWEIDLGQVYDLSAVRLWNRTSCCANRLSNFNVLVSNAPFNNKDLNSTINQNGVGHFPFPGTAGRETNINLNRTGRYLRVQLSGTGILTLAEVEIMGCSTQSFVGAESREAVGDLSVLEDKQASNITGVEISDILISPNPAIDYLNVDVSNYMNESIEYSIQSIDGATRMIGRLTSDHNKNVQLDLSDINNGLYIMHMKPENHKALAVKFVITN